jgi:hypothetical protein
MTCCLDQTQHVEGNVAIRIEVGHRCYGTNGAVFSSRVASMYSR